MELKIKRIKNAQGELPDLPTYATAGAAAMDLCAFIPEKIEIAPMARAVISTGLSIELPAGFAALIMARSGLATKFGLCMANGAGLIDSDYRGELLCSMVNLGDKSFTVSNGDRIAQLMIVPVQQVELCEAKFLGETERGSGGFGSTGVRK